MSSCVLLWHRRVSSFLGAVASLLLQCCHVACHPALFCRVLSPCSTASGRPLAHPSRRTGLRPIAVLFCHVTSPNHPPSRSEPSRFLVNSPLVLICRCFALARSRHPFQLRLVAVSLRPPLIEAASVVLIFRSPTSAVLKSSNFWGFWCCLSLSCSSVVTSRISSALLWYLLGFSHHLCALLLFVFNVTTECNRFSY